MISIYDSTYDIHICYHSISVRCLENCWRRKLPPPRQKQAREKQVGRE